MAKHGGQIRHARARMAALAMLAVLAGLLAIATARPPDAGAVVCQNPSITGAAVVGQPLTATAGSCPSLPVPVTVILEWYRCTGDTETSCTIPVQAPGASPSTYVPVAADAGRRLAVKRSRASHPWQKPPGRL